MVATNNVREIFKDARGLYSSAVDQLDAGDIRDAAEKAWCATKRATDALVLARTNEIPATTAITTDSLDDLARSDGAVKSLVGRYYSRIHHLHGQCFYNGRCRPVETERRIRETIDYIRDAEALAGI